MVMPHGVTIANLVKPNLIAEDFELAKQDVERREKNGNKRRTMVMWKNALTSVWNTRPMKATQKLIDRMPKIMHAIIEAEGFKTPY